MEVYYQTSSQPQSQYGGDAHGVMDNMPERTRRSRHRSREVKSAAKFTVPNDHSSLRVGKDDPMGKGFSAGEVAPGRGSSDLPRRSNRGRAHNPGHPPHDRARAGVNRGAEAAPASAPNASVNPATGMHGEPARRGPSGPRKMGEGTEEEDQGVLSVDKLPGGVQLRVTLLAAGFVIGASGASVREIMFQTGASIQSWSEPATGRFSRPSRVFRVQGPRKAVAAASSIIREAVERYKDLCEGKRRGEYVQRQQRIRSVEFTYQPPPRAAAPQAAALGTNNIAAMAQSVPALLNPMACFQVAPNTAEHAALLAAATQAVQAQGEISNPEMAARAAAAAAALVAAAVAAGSANHMQQALAGLGMAAQGLERRSPLVGGGALTASEARGGGGAAGVGSGIGPMLGADYWSIMSRGGLYNGYAPGIHDTHLQHGASQAPRVGDMVGSMHLHHHGFGGAHPVDFSYGQYDAMKDAQSSILTTQDAHASRLSPKPPVCSQPAAQSPSHHAVGYAQNVDPWMHAELETLGWGQGASSLTTPPPEALRGASSVRFEQGRGPTTVPFTAAVGGYGISGGKGVLHMSAADNHSPGAALKAVGGAVGGVPAVGSNLPSVRSAQGWMGSSLNAAGGWSGEGGGMSFTPAVSMQGASDGTPNTSLVASLLNQVNELGIGEDELLQELEGKSPGRPMSCPVIKPGCGNSNGVAQGFLDARGGQYTEGGVGPGAHEAVEGVGTGKTIAGVGPEATEGGENAADPDSQTWTQCGVNSSNQAPLTSTNGHSDSTASGWSPPWLMGSHPMLGRSC